MNLKLWGSIGTATVLFGLLVFANGQVHQSGESIAVTLASSAFAASLGWLMGIALAPYGDKEKAMFSSFGAAILTFFTGFFASKLNAVADKLIAIGPSYLQHPESVIRLLTIMSTLVITLIITFVFRRYAKTDAERAARDTKRQRDKQGQTDAPPASSVGGAL